MLYGDRVSKGNGGLSGILRLSSRSPPPYSLLTPTLVLEGSLKGPLASGTGVLGSGMKAETSRFRGSGLLRKHTDTSQRVHLQREVFSNKSLKRNHQPPSRIILCFAQLWSSVLQIRRTQRHLSGRPFLWGKLGSTELQKLLMQGCTGTVFTLSFVGE